MKPFFTNNPLWQEQIENIYALLERIKISVDQSKDDVLHLQRNNHILSVGATTAIEGNRLTLQQVFDVINGKVVFASLHDIKEVQNAFAAYEQIPNLDPYSVDDFLKAHHNLITDNIFNEAGQFRTISMATVNGKREILDSVADFRKVPTLVADLLEWGKTNDIHSVIKSSAMHFMIKHIHPFRDGNGRIGRLWQTLILNKWNTVFECLSVETMIYNNQAKYYEALQQSYSKNEIVDCRPFIDFMLDMIENSIYKYIDDHLNDGINSDLFDSLNETEREILSLIKGNAHIKVFEITQKLLKPISTIENNLKQLREKGIIVRIGSQKTGYWEITKY
jgi:Fic family protein